VTALEIMLRILKKQKQTIVKFKKNKLGTMENCIIPWWLLLLITILLSQMLTAGADSGRAAHHIRGRRRHRESNNEVS
jgi:hypothetical protein